VVCTCHTEQVQIWYIRTEKVQVWYRGTEQVQKRDTTGTQQVQDRYRTGSHTVLLFVLVSIPWYSHVDLTDTHSY
jgi:hypothetical protein